MATEFNRFEDINHVPLRVYNRAVTMLNIQKDFGRDKLEKYIESFNEGERKQMYVMTQFIKNKGMAEAKRIATKGLVLQDE